MPKTIPAIALLLMGALGLLAYSQQKESEGSDRRFLDALSVGQRVSTSLDWGTDPISIELYDQGGFQVAEVGKDYVLLTNEEHALRIPVYRIAYIHSRSEKAPKRKK